MVTLIGFLIFIYSIILHEIAHGLVAERLGDPTARLSGRLTLKPGPHIDPVMSILVPLFLILSGSPVIFGSAKPVPIDPYNLRNPRKDMGLVGLAGPATNLAIALAFSLMAKFILSFAPHSAFIQVLQYATMMNITLAILNLIPIPPLDGGRVMVAILPNNFSDVLSSLENFGILIVLFLLLFPNPLFSLQSIIAKISSLVFSLIFPGFPLI